MTRQDPGSRCHACIPLINAGLRVAAILMSYDEWLPCRTASEGSGLASMIAPPLAKPAEAAATVPSTSAASRAPLRASLKSAISASHLHAAPDPPLTATLCSGLLVDHLKGGEGLADRRTDLLPLITAHEMLVMTAAWVCMPAGLQQRASGSRCSCQSGGPTSMSES